MNKYAVQRKCAWCKSEIANLDYRIYNVSACNHYRVYHGDQDLGTAKTYEEAVKLCEQHAMHASGGNLGIIKDGVAYCSLRCLNAYEASTEIKEQRIRIIQGE